MIFWKSLAKFIEKLDEKTDTPLILIDRFGLAYRRWKYIVQLIPNPNSLNIWSRLYF